MGTTPHDLAAMDEQKAIAFLREFVIKLEGRDVSGVTIRTYIKAIKSWWTFNDLEVTRRVRVKDSAGSTTTRGSRRRRSCRGYSTSAR